MHTGGQSGLPSAWAAVVFAEPGVRDYSSDRFCRIMNMVNQGVIKGLSDSSRSVAGSPWRAARLRVFKEMAT